MYHPVLAAMAMSIQMTQQGYVSNDLMESFTPSIWEDELIVRIAEMDYEHFKKTALNAQRENIQILILNNESLNVTLPHKLQLMILSLGTGLYVGVSDTM